MSASFAPASFPELIEAVRSTPRVVVAGAETKPRLSAVDATRIRTSRLCGITEYEPSEFTFTALAGTPIKDIQTALAERGQYLPFDPLLVRAGATLGGTVAAGLSGPGRFRFGGLRDFILGVRFVDGAGRLLRMGGKVVKNAAGFDLPKFFVGSLGRFGILAEITFKVFPAPASRLTLKLPVESAEAAARVMIDAANTRWQADALDYLPDGKTVCVRLAGPERPLNVIAREILARWPGETLSETQGADLWTELGEFGWTAAGGPMVKVAVTPQELPSLTRALETIDGALVHVSGGGNVAFISLSSDAQAGALDERLRALGLRAISFRGTAPLWLGVRSQSKVALSVKNALDAERRFPGLDD